MTKPETSVRASNNLVQLFRATARAHGRQVAFRTPDDAVAISWRELRSQVDGTAAALIALGVAAGDRVALVLSNRPEFAISDLGALTARAVPFSVYAGMTPEQLSYVLRDADARLAIVEASMLEDVRLAIAAGAPVTHLVVLDVDGSMTFDNSNVSVISWPDFIDTGTGREADVENASANIGRDDLATLIYTSGTTGAPKGVELTHGNVLALLEGLVEVLDLRDSPAFVSWLPAAHIAERASHHYLPLAIGGTVTCCADPRRSLEVAAEVHPSWFFAVPRTWEKLKASIEAEVLGWDAAERDSWDSALAAAMSVVRARESDASVPPDVAERAREGDLAHFASLRTRLGFDEADVLSTGAAPTPRAVVEFFHAIGMPIGELWGLSESCAAVTMSHRSAQRIGSVGQPMRNVEIRVAADGELLVRAPQVMRRYRNAPHLTAVALDAEGWLHTGDIGTVDGDGHVRIVDRKKELIVTAGGKNVSPANVETALKSASPLIAHAVAVGDQHPYIAALIVPDPDYLTSWAADAGLTDAGYEALVASDAVRAVLDEVVATANETLSEIERVRSYTIVADHWVPGDDQLTPTSKLRRKPIHQRYAGEIARLFS